MCVCIYVLGPLKHGFLQGVFEIKYVVLYNRGQYAGQLEVS